LLTAGHSCPGAEEVYGISGRSFSAGEGLDPDVAAAAAAVADAIRAELEKYPDPGPG
jgi:hydrogenase maturation protease